MFVCTPEVYLSVLYIYFFISYDNNWVVFRNMLISLTLVLCLFSVESFKEIQDSLCVGQKSSDGCDERVILFLKMAPGIALGTELIRQIQMSIRKELTARHVPAFILEIQDIPVSNW